MLSITHNMSSINTQRQLNINTQSKAASAEKLSTGYKINRAADDAAHLTISEKMRHQIRGLNKGSSNSQDGISLCQVADGALEEVSQMLHRLTELSVQAANDTNTVEDRKAIQKEINEIMQEIDRVGDTTEFNTIPLFKGNDEILYDANGNPIIDSQIPIRDLSLADVSLGNSPFYNGSNANTLNLKAVVTGSANQLNGTSYQFIYGSGSTSHSTTRLRYTDASGAAKTVEAKFEDMTISNFQVDEANRVWSRDLNYTNADGINITITQKIGVTDVSDDEKKYTLGYELKNNSEIVDANGTASTHGNTVDTDFMFHTDTAYNNDDNCERYYIDGELISEFGIYESGSPSYAVADVPDNFSIIDTENALSFSEKISFNGDKPDMLSIGHFGNIYSWSYYNNLDSNPNLGDNAIGSDLGFSAIWNNELSAGDSVNLSFDYGIVTTTMDENLDGVTINYDPRYATTHDPIKKFWIQSGDRNKNGINIQTEEMNCNVLGLKGANVLTHESASSTIDKVAKALDKITSQRSSIGAYQNRLEHIIKYTDNTAENVQAAESRMRDTDMAEEMMKYSKSSILEQASQAMLAQTNQTPESVLTLLQ